MDAFDDLFGGEEAEQETRLDPVALIADALGQLRIPSVAEASLSDRAGLVRLRHQLDGIIATASTYRNAIDRAFVAAAADEEADLIRTGMGNVKLEQAAAMYETKPDAMRDALVRLIPEKVITQDQIDAALPVTITVKPNHTKLNALSHNGKRVKDVIDAHRTRVAPNRADAKPKYPKE